MLIEVRPIEGVGRGGVSEARSEREKRREKRREKERKRGRRDAWDKEEEER